MRTTIAGAGAKIRRASLAEILSPDADMPIVYLLLGTIIVGVLCVTTKLSTRLASISGEGGPVNMAEARVQYKKAADQGYSLAQNNLAKMLHIGEGGPVDMTDARVQYKKAADQGHMKAQHNLACMLREGEGGPVNLKEARVLFKKAAHQGHNWAQYNLAHMLREGKGGPVDMT